MAKNQNIQIKISFEAVKKILIGLFSFLILANLITNCVIDDAFGHCNYDTDNLCVCVKTGFKKLNIFTKVTSMFDEEQFALAKMMASTRCATKMFGNLYY